MICKGKVLGVERRRRWSRDEKGRIVEETLLPGAVVCEVARRARSGPGLLFAWRRPTRSTDSGGRDGSILLPVEIGSMAAPVVSGVIEIELGSGSRVRVDNEVGADALRRVLSVLSER